MQSKSQPDGYVALTHHHPRSIDDAFDGQPSVRQAVLRTPAPTDTAIKHDDGKVMVELLPPEALLEIAKAFTFGAKKYSANNWRKGFKWMRVTGALLRHVYAWMRGEKADPESGLSHLAHAGACLCFLLTFEATGTGEDDRWSPA